MVRHALRLFSLLLFVLAMQWGEAGHTLSHLDDDSDAHTVCELCVAYSAFGHALADSTARPAALGLNHPAPVAHTERAPQPATLTYYLSRAPPHISF